MTWADVAVAGAFVLGIVAGAVGALRAVRHAVQFLKGERDAGEQ